MTNELSIRFFIFFREAFKLLLTGFLKIICNTVCTLHVFLQIQNANEYEFDVSNIWFSLITKIGLCDNEIETILFWK